jgi:asparagine synthase (glutamine-hydrolysing)
VCGIAGYLDHSMEGAQGREVLGQMGQAVRHRGPDGEGVWQDIANGIGIVHRRLEIVGLGQQGRQPMVSQSERFVLAYNGEIYNFRELRSTLEKSGIRFFGNSDTEVLLAGIEKWGIEETIGKAAGMFAFALYDKAENELFLVRDRLGEKPLFFSQNSGKIIFGSDIRALSCHPSWDDEISLDAISSLLGYSYIPDPLTIFDNIKKVKPGWIHRFSFNAGYWSQKEAKAWWVTQDFDNRFAWIEPPANPERELDSLLRLIINEHGSADVPIGTLLSGGIDSTLVTAILQEVSQKSIKTFTVSFQEKEYNEGHYGRQVADKLGTDHVELLMTEDDVLDLIPQLAKVYDEPFADSSQIPMLAVSQVAARDVSAVLTGDGGDEIFGGYNRYIWLPRLCRWRARVPTVIARAIESGLKAVPEGRWNQLGDKLSGDMLGLVPKIPQFGEKVYKIADVVGAKSANEAYHRLVFRSLPSALCVGRNSFTKLLFESDAAWLSGKTIQEKMMLQDMTTYLPGDILVKTDRAAMSVGLETRAPFLDYRVIGFARQLPFDLLFSHGEGKVILRRLLKNYIPYDLVDRPKAGFAVPIGKWLRGPLFDWASYLLSKEVICAEPYFRFEAVNKLWREHLSGKKNCQQQLWPVLMFQSWLLSK